MIQEEGKAKLTSTTKNTKDKKRSEDNGAIRIKTKNVNSIKIDQGDREEMVMNHLRQSQRNWDAWILTETWRSNQSEVVDFQAEEESDEDNHHENEEQREKEVDDTNQK